MWAVCSSDEGDGLPIVVYGYQSTVGIADAADLSCTCAKISKVGSAVGGAGRYKRDLLACFFMPFLRSQHKVNKRQVFSARVRVRVY